MKDKLLSFVVLPSIMFALFLAFSPVGAVKAGVVGEDWRDTSACVANACGTTDGTKTQTLFVEVCDEGCPTRSFSASRRIYEGDYIQYGSTWGPWSSCQNSNRCPNDDENAGVCEDTGSGCQPGKDKRRYKVVINAHACPVGYTYEEQNGPDDCYKVVETFGPIDVVYGLKSSDPNKCHRPTPSSLGIPSWATSAFNTQLDLPEHFRDSTPINCRMEASSTTRNVSCSATLIPCEESCPTGCGYPGGTVADGQGGQKTCDPTNSCSTYRWCSPDETSSTGYKARAISISTPTPDDGGKPWNSTTMINGYCYERCSVITPSYGDWGGWIVDNEDDSQLVRTRTITGYDSVDTTYVCAEKGDKEVMDRPLCQYPGVTYADDPLCAPLDDEGEVLGAEDDATKDTGVVLAATGPTDNIVVYIVELLLVAILVTYSVFFTKTYLKNSK